MQVPRGGTQPIEESLRLKLSGISIAPQTLLAKKAVNPTTRVEGIVKDTKK